MKGTCDFGRKGPAYYVNPGIHPGVNRVRVHPGHKPLTVLRREFCSCTTDMHEKLVSGAKDLLYYLLACQSINAINNKKKIKDGLRTHS